MLFNTANGATQTEKMVDLKVNELGLNIRAHVLDSTPAALPVGKRRVKDGLTFVFRPDGTSYFLDSNGKVIMLEVLDYIPYLRAWSQTSVPFLPVDESVHVFPADGGHRPTFAEDDAGDVIEVAREADSGAFPHEEPVDEKMVEWAMRPVDDPGSAIADVLGPEGGDEPADTVRERATQAEHLLTHLPANPYCPVCQFAKMRQPRHLTGSFARELRRWGQILTIDFLAGREDSLSMGVTGPI